MGYNESSFSERIDNLMKEVLEDSEVKAKELIRQAKEKSKKNIEDAKIFLEKEVNQKFENMNKKIKRERVLQSFETQMQIRNEVMFVKEEVLSSLLNLIEQKFTEFAKNPKYKIYLQRAFKEMLNYLSPGQYILYLRNQDLKKFPQNKLLELNEDPNLEFEISDSEHIEHHGILLKSKDERLTIEDTLEARFNQKREQIRSKIAKMLFND
jgi:vacuolar-type H+-ATPase subunit E/Vma4